MAAADQSQGTLGGEVGVEEEQSLVAAAVEEAEGGLVWVCQWQEL